ncbi:pickpocket protein 28 [Teleopsis dalmanni]|uniref:pickpocket protein 28 n=1 Tax=Teleopsis dalmanni TaxID=139649 RepID=UPI0018CDC167|nr:pickpocket protein 28 [Teleopsis dalmanni]
MSLSVNQSAVFGVYYVTSAYFVLPYFVTISIGLYNNFLLSSISFNLDTLFLNWNTSFPAVTVCEIYNGEKIWDVSEEYFGSDHDLTLDDFVGEIVFFRGTCTSCSKKCTTTQCPNNFTELLNVFRSKCAKLIINCSYTNKVFNCCEEFRPIETEYGTCYAFNSNQARKISQIYHANNRETGAGHLKFDTSADIQLHVHPPIEIPFLFSEGMIHETVLLGTVKEIVLNVMEVYNDATVYHLALDQRRCRFVNELTNWGQRLGIYKYYSFSTCVVECAVALQLEHCNCTSHFLAAAIKSTNQISMCDYRGLRCLTKVYTEMKELRKSCDCMSSCDEPEYNIVYNSADGENEEESDVTQIKVSLIELPTQRYVRRVTKGYLDLIISIGGIAGLFFNASVIRLVEVIFMLVQLRWQQLKTNFL